MKKLILAVAVAALFAVAVALPTAAVAGAGLSWQARVLRALPWVIVAAHVAGACLLWVATLRVYLGMRSRDAPTV